MHSERRRSPRLRHRGFLLFEVPTFSQDFCWPARLLDISGKGLAVTLLPERLELGVGVPVYLSMVFRDRVQFDRVRAILVRQQGDLGAVKFQGWPQDERERLSSLLRELHAENKATPPRVLRV